MNNYFNRVLAVLSVAVVLVLLVAAGLHLGRDTSPAVDPSNDDPLLPAYPKTPSAREVEPEPLPDAAETAPETVAQADAMSPEVVEMFPAAVVEAVPTVQPAVPPKLPTPPGLPNVPDSPFGDSPGLRVQESISIYPPMREIGQAWIDDTGRGNFSMPVPGGESLEIEVDQFEGIGQDGGEFMGTVKGRPGSSVKLSYRGGSEAGMIRIPSENRLLLFMPGQDGQVIVQDRDLSIAEPADAGIPPNFEIPPVPNFTPPPPPDIDVLDPAIR